MTKECAWLVQAETPGIYVVLVIASAVDSETGATVTAQGTAKEGVPRAKSNVLPGELRIRGVTLLVELTARRLSR